MPTSLEVLTAAAASAARNSVVSEKRQGMKHRQVEALVPESNAADERTEESTSFERELTEFLGIGSYRMMDVWIPFDDGLRNW